MRLRPAILAAALLASTAAFAEDEMPTPESPFTSCPQFFYHGIAPDMIRSTRPHTVKSKVICNHGYASGVSHLLNHKLTLWSAEHLTPASVEAAEKTTSKPSLDDKMRPWSELWGEDKALKDDLKDKMNDYMKDSSDEISSLAPAGDFGDVELQRETFSMDNVVMLNKKFNRYLWNDIEEKVREIAKKYPDTYVVTGAIFKEIPYFSELTGKADSPIRMWKSIYVPGHIRGMYLASNDDFPLCMIIPDHLLLQLSGIILRPETLVNPTETAEAVKDIPSVPEMPFKVMDDGRMRYLGCLDMFKE